MVKKDNELDVRMEDEFLLNMRKKILKDIPSGNVVTMSFVFAENREGEGERHHICELFSLAFLNEESENQWTQGNLLSVPISSVQSST